MKGKLLTIGLSIALGASLLLLGRLGCTSMELKERTSQLNAELMKANLALGRAETQFGEAQKYANQLEEAIQQEIKEREGVITRYAELEARFERLRKKKTRTRVVYRDKTVTNEALNLTPGALYYADNATTLQELDELSGWVEDDIIKITATVKGELTSEGYFPFEFEYDLRLRFGLKLVETRLPTGAINNYAEVYAVDKSGKIIQRLRLDRFQVIVENPESSQWFWWAPHLDVGAIGAVKLTPPGFLPGGSIGISFMGYGKTVNDLEWRVGRLSFDLAGDRPGVGLTPGLWNAGSLIPLISNLWLGPHLLWLPPEDWGIGLFVGAVL